MGVNRQLAIQVLVELLFGTFETQTAEGEAQMLVRCIENVARARIIMGKVLAKPRFLRTLPRI